MKTRYLNAELRKDIESAIRAHVTGKMKKSIPGKELADAEKKIVKAVKGLVLKDCPTTDLKVLEKYKLTTKCQMIHFTVDNKGIIRRPWYSERDKGLRIELSPWFETRKVHDSEIHLVELINSDETLMELCRSAYKVNDHIQCEIRETVSAYMVRVKKFRTVAALLNAHHTMKKFIPKEAAPTPPPEPTRADKLIEQFEAA